MSRNSSSFRDSGNGLQSCIRPAAAALIAVLLSCLGVCTAPAQDEWSYKGKDEDHRFAEFVYVVNGGSSNDLSGFQIDAVTGVLMPIAGSPFPTEPLFTGNVGTSGQIAVDSKGKFAYVADPGIPDVSSVLGYSIEPTTGVLTPLSGSPSSTDFRAMFVVVDPKDRFAYIIAAEGGNVSGFTIDAATGLLTPVAGSPFAGPFLPMTPAVDPRGRFLYVPDLQAETVWGYEIDAATGALTPIAGSPFAAGREIDGVTVDPTGRFAYATNIRSNVGPNGDISAFTINSHTGALDPIAGSPFATGNAPDPAAVDPTGRFLYVPLAGSNAVAGYHIHRFTGALTPIAGSPFAAGTQPISAAVDSTGRFLYVTNQNDGGQGSVSAYSIERMSGALEPIAGSPFLAGMSSTSIAIAVRHHRRSDKE